jgi:hypothetical protein
MSPERVAKGAATRTGKPHPVKKSKPCSEERKAKISAALKGRIMDCGWREKISLARRGKPHPNAGHPQTPETRLKISVSHKGKRCGKDAPGWKGGKSFEPYCPKWTKELRERIRAFFDYECLVCGKSTEENKRKLGCHHVEYNKLACCDGKPVHFAALCQKCHGNTNHERDRWESMLHRIIDEIYDGKSYYTKEEWGCM